jgi:hypothetical protein
MAATGHDAAHAAHERPAGRPEHDHRGPGEPGRALNLTLWFALLAPPLALLLNQQTVYGLVPKACANGWWGALRVIPLAFLALALAGGLAAWRGWRASGPSWPGSDAHPMTRARFMAVVAMLGCALFSLILAGHWAATLMIEPCQ